MVDHSDRMPLLPYRSEYSEYLCCEYQYTKLKASCNLKLIWTAKLLGFYEKNCLSSLHCFLQADAVCFCPRLIFDTNGDRIQYFQSSRPSTDKNAAMAKKEEERTNSRQELTKRNRIKSKYKTKTCPRMWRTSEQKWKNLNILGTRWTKLWTTINENYKSEM